jgi:hypothetical protein
MMVQIMRASMKLLVPGLLAFAVAILAPAARAQVGAVVGGPAAKVAVSDSTRLERAQRLYHYGHFEDAVTLLADTTANPPLAPAEIEMLGRSYVRMGEPEHGYLAFTRLLDAAPGWRPDPRELGGDEQAVFARARRDWRQAHPEWLVHEADLARALAARRPWYRQRRVQLGAGLATVGIVALVRHQHSAGQSDALPDLPGHP